MTMGSCIPLWSPSDNHPPKGFAFLVVSTWTSTTVYFADSEAEIQSAAREYRKLAKSVTFCTHHDATLGQCDWRNARPLPAYSEKLKARHDADGVTKALRDGLNAIMGSEPRPVNEINVYGQAAYRLEIRPREDGHNRPHFHIVGPGYDGSYSIPALKKLVGDVPKKVEQAFLLWATEHMPEIVEKWNQIHRVQVSV